MTFFVPVSRLSRYKGIKFCAESRSSFGSDSQSEIQKEKSCKFPDNQSKLFSVMMSFMLRLALFRIAVPANKNQPDAFVFRIPI
jgi:hypothetical protein